MKNILIAVAALMFSVSVFAYDGYGDRGSGGYYNYGSSSDRPFVSGFPRQGQSLNSHIAERNARSENQQHRERVEQHMFKQRNNSTRTYNPGTGGFD